MKTYNCCWGWRYLSGGPGGFHGIEPVLNPRPPVGRNRGHQTQQSPGLCLAHRTTLKVEEVTVVSLLTSAWLRAPQPHPSRAPPVLGQGTRPRRCVNQGLHVLTLEREKAAPPASPPPAGGTVPSTNRLDPSGRGQAGSRAAGGLTPAPSWAGLWLLPRLRLQRFCRAGLGPVGVSAQPPWPRDLAQGAGASSPPACPGIICPAAVTLFR